jgi:hypothetical protein
MLLNILKTPKDLQLSKTGVDPGGGGGRTRRAHPSPLKIVIFHTKYPKNVRASHRSAQFF